ncbi:hypothetical protein ACRJ4B_08640 [Streptomyces sp. GTA36]
MSRASPGPSLGFSSVPRHRREEEQGQHQTQQAAHADTADAHGVPSVVGDHGRQERVVGQADGQGNAREGAERHGRQDQQQPRTERDVPCDRPPRTPPPGLPGP